MDGKQIVTPSVTDEIIVATDIGPASLHRLGKKWTSLFWKPIRATSCTKCGCARRHTEVFRQYMVSIKHILHWRTRTTDWTTHHSNESFLIFFFTWQLLHLLQFERKQSNTMWLFLPFCISALSPTATTLSIYFLLNIIRITLSQTTPDSFGTYKLASSSANPQPKRNCGWKQRQLSVSEPILCPFRLAWYLPNDLLR